MITIDQLKTVTAMRPGWSIPILDTYTGPTPAGWHWQVKLDDERCIVTPDGRTLNRFGEPFSPAKIRPFLGAITKLRERGGEAWFDLALLGWRCKGVWEPGSIVLLDVPSSESWSMRWSNCVRLADELCVTHVPGMADSIYVLDWTASATDAWTLSKSFPGAEGIIGRNPDATYESGDSRNMCKCKWKN